MEIPVKKILNSVGSVSAIVLGLGCQLLPSVNFYSPDALNIGPEFKNGKAGYNIDAELGFPYRGYQSLALILGVSNLILMLFPLFEKAIKEEESLSLTTPKDLINLSDISQPQAPPEPAIAPKSVKIASLAEKLQANAQDLSEWLSTPHQSIAGNSGSGKTTVMQYCISLWLAENPTGTLQILDCNIGKPDSSGRPNTWKGLAKLYGKSKLEDIKASIEEVYADLQRRLDKCREAVAKDIEYLAFDPYLVVIDEFNSLQSDLLSVSNYDIIPKIQLILQQGRALGIKLLLGLQSYDKETSRLPMASNAMTSKLWLAYKSVPTDLQFRYLSISKDDPARKEFCELIAQKNRAGLIQIEGANRAIVLPDLSKVESIELNETEIWWRDWLEANQDQIDLAIRENMSASELADFVKPSIRRGTARFKKLQNHLNTLRNSEVLS